MQELTHIWRSDRERTLCRKKVADAMQGDEFIDLFYERFGLCPTDVCPACWKSAHHGYALQGYYCNDDSFPAENLLDRLRAIFRRRKNLRKAHDIIEQARVSWGSRS